MRSASEEIYNEGVEQGIRQGEQNRLLDNVRTLVETAGWTVQEALDKLRVPEDDRQRYLAML